LKFTDPLPRRFIHPTIVYNPIANSHGAKLGVLIRARFGKIPRDHIQFYIRITVNLSKWITFCTIALYVVTILHFDANVKKKQFAFCFTVSNAAREWRGAIDRNEKPRDGRKSPRIINK
jgi:hypothetical protein